MLGTLRDLFSFLLTQGISSMVWVGGLAAAGMLAGVFLSFACGFALRRLKLGKRRKLGMSLLVIYNFIALPISMSLLGSLAGSAFAVRDLTQNPVLVRRAVDLSFDGTEKALSSLELAPDQRQLVIDFVSGDTAFPFDEIEGTLDQMSDDTLRKILELYDDRWNDQDGVFGIASRELGRRLTKSLIEGRAQQGRNLIDPAIDELRLEDNGDGAATGPEIGAALAHHGVQKPLAKWAFYAVLSQAIVLVPFVLLLLFGPLVCLALWDWMRPDPSAETEAAS